MVHQFLLISQKHTSRCIGFSKVPIDVSDTLVQSLDVYSVHTQSTGDQIWIHCDPEHY